MGGGPRKRPVGETCGVGGQIAFITTDHLSSGCLRDEQINIYRYKTSRVLQDNRACSNLRGMNPIDFESIALTARPKTLRMWEGGIN